MAKKHHHPKIHYGDARRGSLCGLPSPCVGAGITEDRPLVTCLACLNVLAATDAPEGIDAHALRQFRVARREYALAMGAGRVYPARRLGHLEGPASVPLRRAGPDRRR